MRLGSLFTDGAVVQCGRPVVVWGWCGGRQLVRVRRAGREAVNASAWDGYFEVRLPAIPAGGPYELEVEAAGERAVVHDVLSGEVWLASGQSNMEFPLRTFTIGDPEAQTEQYLAEGGVDPWIRMATVPHQSLGAKESTAEIAWRRSDASTAAEFSAVGAWFALNLRKRLKVPVGIIHASWGGTCIQAWMSRECLVRLPQSRGQMEEQDAWTNLPDNWKGYETQGRLETGNSKEMTYRQFCEPDRGNGGVGKGWAAPEFDDGGWPRMEVPGSWIGQGINQNGATWVRIAVDIPAAWAGQDLELHLGCIDKHDVTYFNGVEVGATGKGFEDNHWTERRRYPVPGKLVRGGRNVVAIRGFSFLFDGSFGGKSSYWYVCRKGEAEGIPLAGKWPAQAEYTVVAKISAQRGNGPRPDETAPFNQNSAHHLFDGMIRPLIPYAMRGAIWYQGEQDADVKQFLSTQYEERLAAMIGDWRYRWGQGDFPFYFVQLANYQAQLIAKLASASWCQVREAQRRVARSLPNTGAIVATDIGEDTDIHPHNKREFGRRLALLALHGTYGMSDVVPSGPAFREAQPAPDGALRLIFDWAEGLHPRDGQAPRGFEVAGYDLAFHAAEATLDGTAVVVRSDAVPFPVHARYAWESCPPCDLVNGADLPAMPFTTLPRYC